MNWNNFFFLIGVAAVIVMLLTFDVSFIELWHHLCHAGYWLIPILGVWVIIYGMNAMAWKAVIEGVIKKPLPISFLRLFKLTVSGYALNYATPVGGLGGEPYRILELSKDISKQEATSSVILYAMMHFFAHFWLWFSSVFLYFFLAAIGDLPITLAIGIILGVIVVFCLIAFWLFSKGYRNGIARKAMGWLTHIPLIRGWATRFVDSHQEALENIDRQIAALFSQDKKAFFRSFFLEYFSRIVQATEILFMLLLFGVDCGGGVSGICIAFLHSVLILAFTTLFANLIGFLPMQIGVQEGGFVLSIAALGLSAALGIFVSIICRVREIIWIFIGLVLMKIK